MSNPYGDPNRIAIFDTTLRDGEQSPGCSMTPEEKTQVAQVLEEMNVDVIEAGMPIASRGEFEAVSEISKLIKKSAIAGMARAKAEDIQWAWEALKHAVRPRIHTFISTSPVHIKLKLGIEPEAVLEAIIDSVGRARNLCPDVEWSAEDGTRSEPDFLCRCVELAIKAGAQTINIPDSVGYTEPEEFHRLIEMLINRVPNIDEVVISVHCHDDLGLALANSLAAVKAGARQVECSINGIGERAGNAALEEIIMALRTRHDAMPYTTGVDSRKILKASRLVSAITGFTVQPNKAIVGANAFAHESGGHQDGVLKSALTYEIMKPESVGLHCSTLVMGKHSGRRAFRSKLRELGFKLNDNQLQVAFERFKDVADAKKDVLDEDIIAIINETVVRLNEHIRFESLNVTCTSNGPQKAELELVVDGEKKCASAGGNGPVDAIFAAIGKIYPTQATLQIYQVQSVTGGTDAQVEASVRLEEHGISVSGLGADHDTLVASARAYVNALNKLAIQREKAAFEPYADAWGSPTQQQGVNRKLTAILAADAVGYSRLIGENDEATLETLNTHFGVIKKRISSHQGRVFGGAGDSVVADFGSAVEAVRCAIEIQQDLKGRNADLPEERRMRFRIGIDIGEVVVEGDDVHGNSVNIATRLEALAKPGGVCLSGDTYRHVKNRLDAVFEDLGEQNLKNIVRRVQVYQVR